MSRQDKFTEFVSFEIAERLNNAIYPDEGFAYAAEDLECTNDHFTGSVKHKKGEFFDAEGDYVHGKHYWAPTYGEVLDYLSRKFGVHVEFTPWFTYALEGHTAYTYRVFKVNDETAKMDLLFESGEGIGSFGLCVKEIVDKLINTVK